MARPRSQRMVAGLALIVLGLGLYFLQQLEGLGYAAIFFVIGAAFLAFYFYQRAYGLLIPACILLGLGAGSAGERTFLDFGDSRMLGLGFGFVAIYVISLLYERRSQWWPLIPGAALILLGLRENELVWDYLWRNWPLILVVVGLLILLGAFRRPRRATGEDG